jgi:hypothetical protein
LRAAVERRHFRVVEADVEEQQTAGLALQGIAERIGHAGLNGAQAPFGGDLHWRPAEDAMGDEGHQNRAGAGQVGAAATDAAWGYPFHHPCCYPIRAAARSALARRGDFGLGEPR